MKPINYSDNPVKVCGEPLHPILWRGRQWAVTEHGVECLDGSYCCEAKRLSEHLPDHSWCEHMAEKDWVDIDDFTTAWLVAIALYGTRFKPAQVRAAVSRSRPYMDAMPDPGGKDPSLTIRYGWETTKP